MTTWTVDEALKWADTWGPTDGEPPTGDQLALATLARVVRAAGAELASLRQCFEAADRERGELRADAERYRYVLKHVRRIDICGVSISQTSVFQLSARIDAACAQRSPRGQEATMTDKTAGVGPVERGVRPPAMVYALRAPSGALVPETVTHDKRQAWCKAFDFLCSIDPQYEHKYWKRWDVIQRAARRRGLPQVGHIQRRQFVDASQRAARRRGWRVVRANLVPAA